MLEMNEIKEITFPNIHMYLKGLNKADKTKCEKLLNLTEND